MNALRWLQFLEAQKTQGKTVFTVTELANAAGSSLPVARVTAQRLVERGVLSRVGHGRYALPRTLSVADVVRSLDAGAYLTAEGALHLHGMATQVPSNWTCFTNKRHGQSRVRSTPAARVTFVCVAPSIYHPPPDEPIASPEQALCDYVHLARRAGIDPRALLTLRHLERLNRKELARVLTRYSPPVQDDVRRIVK